MEIRPVEAELFHAGDGQTIRHGEVNSHFSQFFELVQRCIKVKSIAKPG
jgi:hypothetical protein